MTQIDTIVNCHFYLNFHYLCWAAGVYLGILCIPRVRPHVDTSSVDGVPYTTVQSNYSWHPNSQHAWNHCKLTVHSFLKDSQMRINVRFNCKVILITIF